MQVIAEVKRADLFWTHIRALGDRRTWSRPAIAVAALIAVMVALDYPRSLTPSHLQTVAVSFLPLLFLLPMMGVATPVFAASVTQGQLGPRTYTLGAEAIFVTTPTSEIAARWQHLRSIRKTRQSILVEVSPDCFWIIPRRAFPTPWHADQFYLQALSLWKAVAPGA